MKKIQDFKVVGYRWLNDENYVLSLSSDEKIENILPGNFAEIQIPDSPDVFLRRPISIQDVDYDKNQIHFFIKAIGKGTRKLGTLQPGSTLNIVYPLGNSFTIKENAKTLLVGGGSGIAPLKLLAQNLHEKNSEVTFLLGARTSNDVFFVEDFSEYGKVLITTEDGSMGEKGLVTNHSVFTESNNFDMIYTCGPDPMMKAIANIAAAENTECEASLENMMACGIGACLCCVTPTEKGNLCVCTEGPVFNTKILKW